MNWAASEDRPGAEGHSGTDAIGLDLICPGCDADLAGAESFTRYRVCPSCGRHFPIPARERLALILDPDGFVETNAALLSLEPLVFHDSLPFPDRLAEAQEPLSPPGLAEGVITGLGTIDGVAVVIVVLDLALLGGSIGALAGEKVTLALEQAAVDRLPVVAICAGGRGPERAAEGLLALAQIAKIAAAAASLRRAGVPMISLVAHPATGGVYVGVAGQADIVLAEPGARIGFSHRPNSDTVDRGRSALPTAEALLAGGQLDAIVERPRLRSTLARLLDFLQNRGGNRVQIEQPVIEDAGPSQPRWEHDALARHPDRPSGRAYLSRLSPDIFEIHGDHIGADDPSIVCGLGRVAGISVAVVAQDRVPLVDSQGSGGGITAAGFRKADRLLRLAGRLELPVLVLIDGPGPVAGTEADAEGIGNVLAQALGRTSTLPVPIVTAILGEAGGVAAIALGLGDRTLMLEHAVFTLAGVGGGPAAGRQVDRATPGGGIGRGMTARECQRLGIVDLVVPEPVPAAHADPEAASRLLEAALAATLGQLIGVGPRALLAQRSRRLRTLGMTTPEGLAATRREALELLDLHDLPRHLTRSIAEWRDRLETRYRAAPRLGRPQLHLPRPDLAGRLSTLRANVTLARGRWGVGAEPGSMSSNHAARSAGSSGGSDAGTRERSVE